MVVEQVLKEAKIPYRRSRYTARTLPATYAVYMDDQTADGADKRIMLITHQITVELYEAQPDDAAETAIEESLSARGILWTKQDRLWLQEEQRYQVIYEFEYITKRRA